MAAKRRTPRGKFTKAQIERHVETVEAAVEKARREHTGDQFVGITADEIREALAKADSPFISFIGWTSATPGSTINVTVGVFNPDPPPSVTALYLHLFIGPTHAVTDVGEYFLSADTRFHGSMQPGAPGFVLASGASTAFTFSLAVPASIQKTNYVGNAALVRARAFDVGLLLSRATFTLTVL